MLALSCFLNAKIFKKLALSSFGEPATQFFRFPMRKLKTGFALIHPETMQRLWLWLPECVGIPAYIVMPENAPEIKKIAVAGYGAQITFCTPTLEARESTLKKVATETGATEIHPYNYFNVICGQGTAAKELIEEIGTLNVVMAPVGGGGLLSGTAISTKAMLSGAKVIAAEPAGADDAFRSFYSKTLQPSVAPRTIADGLLTSLGSITFPIILKEVDQIATVFRRKHCSGHAHDLGADENHHRTLVGCSIGSHPGK